MNDPRWNLLETAEPLLSAAFSARGVIEVRFVAAFPLSGLGVWLVTESDSTAQSLREVPELKANVISALRTAGFLRAELDELGVVVQSQETVERDYEGSWFYAMR
ncbi:hypothetical protein [Herbiconiux ginsengi]|uniref:Uncharacterized protein n=1 Tax=Herbiconiux ginsengi TaxID=381665 RepID=A0A1H3S5Q7_9MICO|nr:hypothetical protein [Herbiconiux ginsengi]SDZ32841.1 hypothetical protein SAMN05216554_3301 [Herbiconiux ginsengi]